jgi:hypothetical protein
MQLRCMAMSTFTNEHMALAGSAWPIIDLTAPISSGCLRVGGHSMLHRAFASCATLCLEI